jgi:glycosyltransferase involved in cell wall biosynthesis
VKFSVVTISFNQADYVERAVRSVLEQRGVDIEYIVVDPGSSDGSRDVLERYRERIDRLIFERDQGPADGLNKGFAYATGDVFCYLNSDDEFEPGAFARIAELLATRPETDVLCGHAWVVDEKGTRLRRVWSDPFERVSQAYGTSIQIQPSTFIRASAFRRTTGFNVANRSNWDGELLIDLALSGAKIEVVNEFLSKYRVYGGSITGSGSLDEQIQRYGRLRFRKLLGRDWRFYDPVLYRYWLVLRQFRNPPAFVERLRHGPVYRRASRK